MSLTPFERKALEIYAKTCEPKDNCGTALQTDKGICGENCPFHNCCLKCFLRGEMHRLKSYINTVTCRKELHDYFYDNTILTEDFPLAGLKEHDVETAINLLQAIRKGMESEEVVRRFFGVTEELAKKVAGFSELMKEETRKKGKELRKKIPV